MHSRIIDSKVSTIIASTIPKSADMFSNTRKRKVPRTQKTKLVSARESPLSLSALTMRCKSTPAKAISKKFNEL